MMRPGVESDVLDAAIAYPRREQVRETIDAFRLAGARRGVDIMEAWQGSIRMATERARQNLAGE